MGERIDPGNFCDILLKKQERWHPERWEHPPFFKINNVGAERIITVISKTSCCGRNSKIFEWMSGCEIEIENGVGSVLSFIAAVLGKESEGVQLFVLNDKEEAAYFYNDLLFLLGEEKLRFLPASFRRSGNFEDKDNDSILVRTEVLNALVDKQVGWVVTYTEALAEKVVNKEVLADMSMPVSKGDKLSISFLEDLLSEYNFERSDFVYEPGQFSIRGSIVDIYSFAEERPVRLDFFGDRGREYSLF